MKRFVACSVHVHVGLGGDKLLLKARDFNGHDERFFIPAEIYWRLVDQAPPLGELGPVANQPDITQADWTPDVPFWLSAKCILTPDGRAFMETRLSSGVDLVTEFTPHAFRLFLTYLFDYQNDMDRPLPPGTPP